MTASEFVQWIEKNAARVTHYEKGADGSNGGCDCIGLIIGAWRMAGNSWPWTHGSNYTARYLTLNLLPEQPLKLGDFVYKARPPGAAGYSLPDAYKNSPDQLDYYHIGVVTSENPLIITHCTSVDGGIKRDTKRGEWKYSGMFSKVSYPDENEQTEEKLLVYEKDGETVNLRSKPSTANGEIIKRVPSGETVLLIKYHNSKWAYVKYGQTPGYMMREFLLLPDNNQSAADLINQIYSLLEKLKTMIGA